MTRYRNVSGDSGVRAFELGRDFIRVQFATGATYLYSYASTGRAHIEQMKKLAVQGRGLSTYISTEVRDEYERREA